MTMRDGFTAALLCAMLSSAYAADGELDPTFGTSGVAHSGIDDATAGATVVVQPDGRILTCGERGFLTDPRYDFFISRFLANGTLDTSFGEAGHVTVDFDFALDYCAAIKVQPDGRIVAAGSRLVMDGFGGGVSSMAVLRLDANGNLDPTFGGGTGKQTIVFDTGSSAGTSLAIQHDGKLLIAGEANVSRSPFKTDFAVVRLLPDGSLDAGFGVAGKVTAGFGEDSTYDRASSIALDDQDRILLGGGANLISFSQMGVMRLLPDGQLDTTFGIGGQVLATTDGVAAADANRMIVQHDGAIVLSGQRGIISGSAPQTDIAVVRLLSNGTLDTTFSGDGLALVLVDLGSNGNVLASAYDVVEQPDHRLVLAGIARTDDDYWKAVAVRLDSSGAPDPSFGNGGTAIFAFSDAQLFGGVGLSDGRVVAVGSAIVYGPAGTTADTVVVRLRADALFANSFD
jgi:uncharacterized delta-60 repeat protein